MKTFLFYYNMNFILWNVFLLFSFRRNAYV